MGIPSRQRRVSAIGSKGSIVISFRYARTAILAALLGATTATAYADTQYFEGEYVCKDIPRHNFWAVDLDAKTVQLGIRRLDRVNNPNLRTGTLEIDGNTLTLTGERNTNLYAKGTVSEDGRALDLTWTGRKGKPRAGCAPFTLTQTEDTPTARWDAFLALAEAPEPTTDDMENSLAMAREMPHAELLPALDQQVYRQKRQAANRDFRTRYQNRVPAIIAASSVATPEDRDKLRDELKRMKTFGFRIDLPGLYARHLYRNDITPSPAYLTAGEENCQPFKTNAQFFSTDHLEGFVGLPRY